MKFALECRFGIGKALSPQHILSECGKQWRSMYNGEVEGEGLLPHQNLTFSTEKSAPARQKSEKVFASPPKFWKNICQPLHFFSLYATDAGPGRNAFSTLETDISIRKMIKNEILEVFPNF